MNASLICIVIQDHLILNCTSLKLLLYEQFPHVLSASPLPKDSNS